MDETAKKIAYISQDIASNYLYLYNDSKNSTYKARLKNSVHLLEESFRTLAIEVEDRDTKDILDFLSYSKDQIKDVIEKDLSKDRVSEILDYSGTILEGVESIIKSTQEDDNRLSLLKLTKFYMLYKLGFDTKNSKNEIQKYIDILDEDLEDNISWSSYKRLVELNEAFFPNMILILTKDLEGKL
jgi:hypothetical protein